MIVYDTKTSNDFVSTVSLNIASNSVTTIGAVNCKEETQAGTYYFSCQLISGTGTLSEFFFEVNPASYAVRTVNETNYNRYKDYSPIDVKANGSFIVVKARGVADNPGAVLVYKRMSAGGNGHLFSGIDPEMFGYKDVGTLQFELYYGDNIYKLLLQPVDSSTLSVFRVDDLKANFLSTDLSSLTGGTIAVNGSTTTFTLTAGFTESTSKTNTSSSGTTSAASTSNTGLLIGLIIGAIAVLALIAGIIGYIIYKQGQKSKGDKYKESGRDSSNLNVSINNKSFDVVKY